MLDAESDRDVLAVNDVVGQCGGDAATGRCPRISFVLAEHRQQVGRWGLPVAAGAAELGANRASTCRAENLP